MQQQTIRMESRIYKCQGLDIYLPAPINDQRTRFPELRPGQYTVSRIELSTNPPEGIRSGRSLVAVDILANSTNKSLLCVNGKLYE